MASELQTRAWEAWPENSSGGMVVQEEAGGVEEADMGSQGFGSVLGFPMNPLQVN